MRFFFKEEKIKEKYSVNNYVKNIRDTLDYFQNNLPKTLVNLVLTLDVTGIDDSC